MCFVFLIHGLFRSTSFNFKFCIALGIDLYSLLFILNFNFCCFNLPEFIKTCFVEERRVCFAQWLIHVYLKRMRVLVVLVVMFSKCQVD